VKEKYFTMKNKQKLEIEKQTKNKKPKNFYTQNSNSIYRSFEKFIPP